MNLARTSIEQSRRQIEFFDKNVPIKTIKADYFDPRPLLLIVSKQYISPGEGELAAKGETLFENETLKIVELSLN